MPISRVVFALSLVLYGAMGTARAQSVDFERRWDRQLKPLLEKYCLNCHGGQRTEGDFSIVRAATLKNVLSSRKVWLTAVAKLRAGEMPPRDVSVQPTAVERTELADGMELVLSSVDCGGAVEPGRVTLRRLTRYEYRNTVRDLTGVDYTPAQEFPADDTGYGFDNIGDVLTLSPILLEKYLAAAERIVAKAVVAEPLQVIDQTIAANSMRSEGGRVERIDAERRCLMTPSKLLTSLDIQSAGEYEFRIRAAGDQAGDEPVKMGLLVDGTQERVVSVRNARDDLKEFVIKKRLTPGSHQFGLEFLNDFWQPEVRDPKKRDRNLIVASLQIKGPKGTAAVNLPDSHQKIIFVTPGPTVTRREASEKVLRRFASWAYRRPAKQQEVDRLVALTEQQRQRGATFEQGIQLALQAVLISPHFLYKVELDPPGREGLARPLNEFEVATRLSYFLWSSGPDAELLSEAVKNRLLTGDGLDRQITRLLRDIRSRALIENFVSQWLELRSLELRRPDGTTFPTYGDELEFAMRRETELFVWNVLQENGSIVDLLASNFTYVNEPLARLYGISGVAGEQFQRIDTRGTHRGGLVTQASFLTVTSNPNRTSPVKRGRFILDNILGAPPPPPPPNVPELNRVSQHGTLRERLEQHRVNPICAACHAQMDPLGFALENYDGIGRWRDREGARPIDASGKLPSGETFTGPDELRKLLVARKDQFTECLTEKLLTYALGRGLEYYDKCTVDRIVERVRKDNYRFSTLIRAIVHSEPFLKRGAKENQP